MQEDLIPFVLLWHISVRQHPGPFMVCFSQSHQVHVYLLKRAAHKSGRCALCILNVYRALRSSVLGILAAGGRFWTWNAFGIALTIFSSHLELGESCELSER